MSKKSRHAEAMRAQAEALAYAKEQDAIKLALADEQDAQRRAFAEKQFAYAQDIDARNIERADAQDARLMERADAQDARRDGIVSDMMSEAEVSDAELGSRVNNASSDVTKSFLKARGITNRNLARYGINPADGRYGASAKENEADLVTADVAARNSARAGVRGEEKAGRTAARYASLGISDTSLGLRDTSLSLNNNQLNQRDAGANNARLGLTSLTGNQLNTNAANATAIDHQKSQEKSGSGWGALAGVAGMAIGAAVGGPTGAMVGGQIGSAVGGQASGGGGGGGYYAPTYIAPGGSNYNTGMGPALGAEGTGFDTY